MLISTFESKILNGLLLYFSGPSGWSLTTLQETSNQDKLLLTLGIFSSSSVTLISSSNDTTNYNFWIHVHFLAKRVCLSHEGWFIKHEYAPKKTMLLVVIRMVLEIAIQPPEEKRKIFPGSTFVFFMFLCMFYVKPV